MAFIARIQLIVGSETLYSIYSSSSGHQLGSTLVYNAYLVPDLYGSKAQDHSQAYIGLVIDSTPGPSTVSSVTAGRWA